MTSRCRSDTLADWTRGESVRDLTDSNQEKDDPLDTLCPCKRSGPSKVNEPCRPWRVRRYSPGELPEPRPQQPAFI
jgi:hypothetical protein